MPNNFTLPTVNDTQDIFSMFQFINNTSSGGLFFPIILLSIWAIAFIGSIVEGKEAVRAWIYASFVAAILAIPLGVMGMLGSQWIYLLILFVAFGVFWIRLQNAPPA
jgi:hypothetical protein